MKNLLRVISPFILGGALLFSNPVNIKAEEPKTFTSISSGIYEDFSEITATQAKYNPLFKIKIGGGPYILDKKAKLEASLSYGIGMGTMGKLESYQLDFLFHYLIPFKKGLNFRVGAGLTEMNFVETKNGMSSKVNESFAFGSVITAGLDINLDKKNSFYIELLGYYTPFRVSKGYNSGIGGISLDAGLSFNSFF